MTAVYPVYGRRLESMLPLPEIDPCGGEPDWRFGLATLDDDDPVWFHVWPTEHGSPWVRACHTASGYRIRYEGRADFLIDRWTRTIACDPRDCPDGMMRHFLLDQVLPLTLSLDAVVLHASSVAMAGGLAAFIGPGGAGKSTVALALGRTGRAVGSDDGLAIDRSLLAAPSYPSIRVWEDSATVAGRPPSNGAAPPTAKRLYREGFARVVDPVPLARLYVLDSEPSVAIRFEPVTPRAAMITLVEQSYRLALDDRDALARELDALARIAREVPMWRLSSPRRLERWRELADAITDHIDRGAAAGAA